MLGLQPGHLRWNLGAHGRREGLSVDDVGGHFDVSLSVSLARDQPRPR
jgi:hypothetical protein